MNVKLVSKGKSLRAEFFGFGLLEVPKIQWVSKGALKMQIIMPDATIVHGLVEPTIAGVAPETIVQFERFGFARIESLTPKIVGVLGHK